MHHNKLNQSINQSRRLSLKAISALPFLGFGFISLDKAVNAADELVCTLAAQMTEGPYWVDEKLNRSDITTGTTRTSVLNGLPLNLVIQIYNNSDNRCGVVPVPNVQIDIWHADAAGEYSDVSGNGQTSTKSQTFLRGYQITDSSGNVNFQTIYPGWYGGRTAHIHLRARVYDASGNVTFNFTTQLFFDDSVTDSAYLNAPYNSRGVRDTRNSNDMHFNSVQSPIILNLSTNSTGGYTGNVAIGLANLPASLVSNSFSVTTSANGTSTMPTLTSVLTVASQDVGMAGSIYVAAEVSGTWYFNNGQNWLSIPPNSSFPAFYTGTLSNTHNLKILSGIYISSIGTINFYVGYGQNAQDMLQKTQYKKAFTVN